MDFTVAVGLCGMGATVVGIVVWSVRQEGRINGHDKLFEERKQQTDDKFDAFCDLQQTRHHELLSRLDRIERKQDAANDHH